MHIDDVMRKGARNALLNGLELKAGETFRVFTDESTRDIGHAFFFEAKNIVGGTNVYISTLENWGERPLQAPTDRIDELLDGVDVTVFAAQAVDGEVGFRMKLIAEEILKRGIRHGHSPNINYDVMATGMQADVAETDRLNTEMYTRLQGVESLMITSPAGTDITLYIGPETKWINSIFNVAQSESGWGNLPGAEVFTSPENVEGVYVVDGVLGDHFDAYGKLDKTPVVYTVKGNKITSISCPKNPTLEKELQKYHFSNPLNRQIGEIGIGALAVDDVIGNILQDEKILGTAHIAGGFRYAKDTNTQPNGATVHCDGVMLRVTIQTNTGEYLFKNGVYQPAA